MGLVQYILMSTLILELIGLLCTCVIPMKKIKSFIDRSLSITTNIFRIEAYDSIMCGYFCIGFVDFMLAGKKLTEYTNLFSPNNFKKNDNVIRLF